MADRGFIIPSSGGGLIRYNEEYKSRFMFKPSHVILLIILIIVFVFALKILYPIAA